MSIIRRSNSYLWILGLRWTSNCAFGRTRNLLPASNIRYQIWFEKSARWNYVLRFNRYVTEKENSKSKLRKKEICILSCSRKTHYQGIANINEEKLNPLPGKKKTFLKPPTGLTIDTRLKANENSSRDVFRPPSLGGKLGCKGRLAGKLYIYTVWKYLSR